MADKESPSVPVIAPDGQAYMIPVNQVGEAFLRGGKPAVRMQAPDGEQYWIAADQAEQGLQHGGTLVKHDGSEYPKGEAPIVVGHNESGQPIWGSRSAEQVLEDEKPQGSARDRLLQSATNVLKGAAKGLFDLRPNEYEQQKGLTSWMDYPLRPFERAVEGQMQEGEQAKELIGNHDYMRGVAHGLAALLPMLGPWAAETGEQASRQFAHGDISGGIGTLGGNAAVAAAMEALPKAVSGGADLARNTAAEMQAPVERLNTPPVSGEMTPRERWEAANRMGVNLDRAQATGSPIPVFTKNLTEHSAAGGNLYRANAASNLNALHEHAAGLVRGIPASEEGPPLGEPMGRQEFGARVQQALQRHRAELVDEPAQVRASQDLLAQASKEDMRREQFGEAAQEALAAHRQSLEDREREIYEDLDKRLGDQGPEMDLVRQKARGIYDKNKRFYDNHPEALKGGDARVWAWVKDLAGVAEKKGESGAGKPGDTWADLQTARSHLLDISRGPEFVGDLATGWAKQLTGAIDQTMTSAEKTPGLSAQDVQAFRQANQLHKTMKQMYDEPQSPFYSIVRAKEPKTAAETLTNLKPQAVREFRDAMDQVDRSDLVGQHVRQNLQNLIDPTRSGHPDLEGLPARWKKADKEQAEEIFATHPQVLPALNDLAQKAAAQTVYEKPGSQLGTIVKAPDGAAASDAMFDSQGRPKLSSDEVQQIITAAPELGPHLQQQTMARMLDPAGNGTPDLRNFASRWKDRSQKEDLRGVLTPQQMEAMSDLAGVARTVQADTNPSGTAKVGQPVGELATAGSAVGSALATGHPLLAAAPIAALATERLASGRMVDPEATAALMEHPKPNLVDSLREGAKTPGVLDAVTQSTPMEAARAVAERPLAATAAAAAAAGANPPTAKDRFREMTQQRQNMEGVSTPPNEGQVASTTTSEPNEVHDAAKEAASLQASQQKPDSGGPATAPPMAKPQPNDVMVRTGASSSSQLGPQAKLEPPAGATHEVLGQNGETLGHIVDGEYVPLEGVVS